MRSNFAYNLIVAFGVLFSIVSAKAKTTYPEELKFLEIRQTPKILSVNGFIEALDSTDKIMLQMPFFFYWESGKYIFDVRLPGGAPAGFFRGDADTVWIYDFMRRVKLVTFLNQGTGWANSMPFTPKDILMVFNLIPADPKDIDTFYNDATSTIVKTVSGLSYVFESATKKPTGIETNATQVRFYDFTPDKKNPIPTRIELNAGLMMPNAAKMVVRVKDLGYKKETNRELIDQTLPVRMPREFDLRQQILQNR